MEQKRTEQNRTEQNKLWMRRCSKEALTYPVKKYEELNSVKHSAAIFVGGRSLTPLGSGSCRRLYKKIAKNKLVGTPPPDTVRRVCATIS